MAGRRGARPGGGAAPPPAAAERANGEGGRSATGVSGEIDESFWETLVWLARVTREAQALGGVHDVEFVSRARSDRVRA